MPVDFIRYRVDHRDGEEWTPQDIWEMNPNLFHRFLGYYPRLVGLPPDLIRVQMVEEGKPRFQYTGSTHVEYE